MHEHIDVALPLGDRLANLMQRALRLLQLQAWAEACVELCGRVTNRLPLVY
jgi:hypothetical protein